jgi:hypothetical protein
MIHALRNGVALCSVGETWPEGHTSGPDTCVSCLNCLHKLGRAPEPLHASSLTTTTDHIGNEMQLDFDY